MRLERNFAMRSAGESSEGRQTSCIVNQISMLHEILTNWDCVKSMIWIHAPEEAAEFLKIVDEVRRYTEEPGEEEQEELLSDAHSILQSAMARLEDEFDYLLNEHRQPLEPECMSFRSIEDDSVDDFSSNSFEEEPIEGKIKLESGRVSGSGVFVIDLIHPNAISELKSIAELMFLSKYDKECCQAYVMSRKDALDECLSILRIERFSIEEVIQMDWSTLNVLIKRWNRSLKVFIRVFLSSERRLCDLIFGDISESMSNYCFLESSKAAILQFLNIGEAIAIGPVEVEKLFRVLDMYEGLTDLLEDMNCLYPENIGSSIMMEWHEVLLRLTTLIKGIFAEFKKKIKKNTSHTPYPGGGVHHITRYVMNYVKLLSDYTETLNMLLKNKEDENSNPPIVYHLHSITSILEANLESRSMLYTDSALQHIFMMNNLCYMVQKVKDSEIQTIFGDDWARDYNRKFRLHANYYERATWNRVLAYLRDEGVSTNVSSSGLSSRGRAIIRDKFKGFNSSIEEVYRTQTAWNIPNVELRVDLRISISLRLIPAYRTFVGRCQNLLDAGRHRDTYIKYCSEDLEKYLLDLFEGSPKVMHS